LLPLARDGVVFIDYRFNFLLYSVRNGFLGQGRIGTCFSSTCPLRCRIGVLRFAPPTTFQFPSLPQLCLALSPLLKSANLMSSLDLCSPLFPPALSFQPPKKFLLMILDTCPFNMYRPKFFIRSEDFVLLILCSFLFPPLCCSPSVQKDLLPGSVPMPAISHFPHTQQRHHTQAVCLLLFFFYHQRPSLPPPFFFASMR